jgi:hypothetical protein
VFVQSGHLILRERIGQLILSERIIGITVEPALANFCGSDHRMFRRVRVPGRMSIRRTVATQRRAALLTRAQMDPLRADFLTLLTHALPWLFEFSYSVDMSADFRGHAAL